MPNPTPFTSMTTLGQLIQRTRKAQGLRLVDTAGLCGVSVRFLSELENGRESCSFGRVLVVCQTLGIELLAARRDGGEL
ncbi:helix-turn-helix domain-containing protein [uncultured Pseudomonas sp.]|uniref:helix-turn-helix domain-containing protein n=1 Tax=uncultured Pseudomonas sp. TaxID=114707 RepID=UPI0025EA2078|nr:helix-turn-helix domain-containing protein [uncultured Pseudomonas sp.]